MISANFHSPNPAHDALHEVTVVDKHSSVHSTKGKLLSNNFPNSSGLPNRVDPKDILSFSLNPAPGDQLFCTHSIGHDTQIETLLFRYIQERNIHEKYLNTLKYILSSENTSLSQIPLWDLQNMLRSLNFSQVSIDDQCFHEYNIKLIKTGAVFFTWTALNRTSIYNGGNNPQKINYVEHIIQTANKLENEHRPVLVIYSNREMPETCVQEMESYFANERNIITLCKERDLGLAFTGTYNKLHQNDHLRLEVLTAQDKVIKTAIEQARKSDKGSVLSNLTTRQASSLIYSDMDNHFIGHFPDYLIAFDGAVDAILLGSWARDHIKKNPRQYPAHKILTDLYYNQFSLDPENLKTPEEIKLMSTITDLLNNSAMNPDCHELFKLASIIKRKKISQYIKEAQNCSLQNELDIILARHISEEHRWSDILVSDNGFIVCSSQNNEKLKKVFTKSCNQIVASIHFHRNDNEAPKNSASLQNVHCKKANRLANYQLSESFLIGGDRTWQDPGTDSIIFYSFIKGQRIQVCICQQKIEIFKSIGNSVGIRILSINTPVIN